MFGLTVNEAYVLGSLAGVALLYVLIVMGREKPDHSDAVQACIEDTKKYIVNWTEEDDDNG